MLFQRPYCACATPSGSSGIAVIRMAGEGCAQVLDRIFTVVRSADNHSYVQDMRGYTAALGYIFDPLTGDRVDEVICTRFVAPYSYTGEDCVEISCHGGVAVRQEILRLLLDNGARSAQPGEFTKRAFLAGKIDLSQAEAVMDVISAESSLALAAAERQLAGALKQVIKNISQNLYEIFAALEMMVEFPEHEDTPENSALLLNSLELQYHTLLELSRSFAQGKILKNGMTVVLGGVPNSGKSSLLNRLAGFDRAIVTPTAGTTRDTLELFSEINGIPVRLIDTAGLRQTEDEIEKMGVARAEDALKEADLLLWLSSPDSNDLVTGSSLYSALSGDVNSRDLGIVISKADLISDQAVKDYLDKVKAQIVSWGFSDRIQFYTVISSATGIGIDYLTDKIRSIYDQKGSLQQSQVVLTNNRHYDLVNNALLSLEQAIGTMQQGLSADFTCSVLRSSMDFLGEITGDTVSEELVSTIFSRFCIGK